MMQVDRIHQIDGYQYRVEMDTTAHVELGSWIEETGFKCTTWNDIISTVIYIKNEQDLVFFLLRWS
jgi:hypothetical protein